MKAQHARLLGHVLERAVAAVEVEPVLRPDEERGVAVPAFVGGRVDAKEPARRVIFDVAGDVEIEVAVPIGVGECRGRTPTVQAQAGLAGHVGEGAITAIDQQGIGTEVADVEIFPPVAVDVRGRHALAITAVTAAARRGLILETTVPQIAEQPVPGRGYIFWGKGSRLDDVKVDPSVAVVVQPGHSGAHRFR